MALTATWVHGNALTVETPSNCAAINHQGWGTDLFIKSGTQTWFHIPISTPVLINNVRAQLVRVFILFETNPGDGFISNVHVYDGSFKPQEFNNLHLEGPHRTGLDGANTFTLAQPHSVAFGIGISFHFVAAVGIDSAVGPFLVRVATAGADFNM
jgi:hypothetical protein